MKKREYVPLTPAALYARVSSDRQDVDLSVAAQLSPNPPKGSAPAVEAWLGSEGDGEDCVDLDGLVQVLSVSAVRRGVMT